MLVQDLLMLGIPNVMMLFSSYSNPVETLKHAQRQGYKALDFMVTAMPFGTYSSEPKVGHHPLASVIISAGSAHGSLPFFCLLALA